MSEADLDRCVQDLARLLRLRTMHIRPARTADGWRTPVQGDGIGWPDWVLVGPSGVLYRECKSNRGRLSADQKAWFEALRAAGCDVAEWRPQDWHSGRIRAEMTAIACTPRVRCAQPAPS